MLAGVCVVGIKGELGLVWDGYDSRVDMALRRGINRVGSLCTGCILTVGKSEWIPFWQLRGGSRAAKLQSKYRGTRRR